MKHLQFFSLLLVLSGLLPQAWGQQILFQNYNVSDGLPSSTVRAIAQDEQGYMWFGTKNGLSRFDGYQFRTFQYRKGSAGGLGNNFIHCITRFDRTHYWIGTEKGVYVLDLETGRFSLFEPVGEVFVFDILRDRDGSMWIASRMNGLYHYDPKRNTTNIYKAGQFPLSVTTNMISKLAQDNDGRIWIGTFGYGVDIYDPGTQRFYNLRAGSSGLSSDVTIALYKGLDGVMWVGTMNGGLCRWQKEEQRFKVYKSQGNHSLKDNIVRAICQTSPGKLYVGTEKGLNVLDLASDQFTTYTNKSTDPFSISDNAVYSIFLDKSGTLWVGTFFGGVSFFNEKGSEFDLYYATGAPEGLSGRAVSSFLEVGPGKFWIGTEDGGLQSFDAATRSFQRYPFTAGQPPLSYHNVHALLKDRKGRIWIGLFAGGVNRYDPRTGQMQYFKMEKNDPFSLNSNNVFSLYEDRDGVVWVGTDNGLCRYREEWNKFEVILKEGSTNTIIYDLYEDQNRTLWVATYNNGLISFDKTTGEWNRITASEEKQSLATNKLICLWEDRQANIWIGTDGGGLNRYNPKTGEVKVYDADQGINGNVIYGIQEDGRGQIWVTSNNGIYSLDPRSGHVKHFSRQDNLQSQQFNYKAFYKATDGKLYAGGIQGFNAFYPERFAQTHSAARLSFTNFQLFNRDVSLSEGNSPLTRQINYTRELVLDHDQSVMSFEFAVLNFRSPEKVRYAYRMEGFDPDWNYVGGQRKATYTNLAPGRYTFRVKATTDEGLWDIPETTLHLVIRPPFYQTTVAYMVYIVALVALVYGLYSYYGSRIRRKNRLKLERLKNKEEQEFYTRKIEFFTVMAHEIRTPLSLIIAPLERLLSLGKWEQAEREQLEVMDENAERLLSLVNQLLDFRRIESDAYQIRKEPVEIVSLVQSVYSRFSSLPYQKDIEFTLSTNISSLELDADPEVLHKILSNLLINAFKFARHQVRLTLHDLAKTENGESSLSISVEDDGIGIPGADLKNIFKKFFTTSSGSYQYHNLGGTGIGLALSSSLADRHGGRLLVESRQGIKTVFTLELPYAGTPVPVATEPADGGSAGDESGSAGPVVLIVEDDEAIQSFLARSFRLEGYRVEKAGNGREALQVVERKAVDIILSDVMMPEMDGITLCRCIKTNIDHTHIPVVLLTARGNREAEIEGVETGADAYILKPFKWKHLAAVVKNLLDSRDRLKSRYSEQPASEVSVLTTNSRDRQFLEKIVGIIESRVTDAQLSVEELSKDMAMCRSSLHKKLKSLSGYGPNELIRLVRLKHAARLLTTNEHSITEVAYLAGFSSSSYFARCFQQQFKMTPKEFADKNTVCNKEEINEFINGNKLS